MYYNASIREYRHDDIPSLKALWVSVFHDEPTLVDRFFELLPSMGTGLVAECSDELFGAAYILSAELIRPDKSRLKLGYIYAVAVEECARGYGIGAELTRACMRYCWENNIDICCTLPAEPSLYGWYKSASGLQVANYCRYECVYPADSELKIVELCADEYGFRRIDLLTGNNYVNFDYGYLLYQEALLKAYGGGFFACEGGIACGCFDGDTLYIKEALGDSPDFIPALCQKLGAKQAVVRRAACEGEPFIAAYEPQDFPADTVWNLALD